MARPFRRLILWLIAAALVLALLVAAVLWWFIDPDRLRLRLQAEATAMLGRPVQLEGPLRWNFAALLAISSGPGSIANVPGFGPEPFARWSNIDLGLALRPLLRREVRIGRITVDGLALRLQRDAAGNDNWSFDLPDAGDESTTLLRIDSLRLRDADLLYEDAGAGMAWRLRETSLQANLPEDMTAPDLRFGDVQVQGQLTGGPLPAAGVRAAFESSALQVQLPRIAVPDFALRWDAAVVRGSLQIIAGDALEVRGRIDTRTPSLRDSLATVGVPVPAMADSTTLGRLQVEADLEYLQSGTAIRMLVMQLDDTRIAGEATLASFSPLSARFDLTADRMALDRYLPPDAAPDEPFQLPLEQLRELDVKGVLRIEEATLAGGQARSVRIDVE